MNLEAVTLRLGYTWLPASVLIIANGTNDISIVKKSRLRFIVTLENIDFLWVDLESK